MRWYCVAIVADGEINSTFEIADDMFECLPVGMVVGGDTATEVRDYIGYIRSHSEGKVE